MTNPLTGEKLRTGYAMFPSGVAALCALVNDQPVGMAASSFTSVSLEPALVSVCVDRGSTTWPQLYAADRIGVSVLGSDQEKLCRALAAKGQDRFANATWDVGPHGAVLLHGASLWLQCRLFDTVPAGDHEIILLEVEDMTPFADTQPLVFHRSSFRVLA